MKRTLLALGTCALLAPALVASGATKQTRPAAVAVPANHATPNATPSPSPSPSATPSPAPPAPPVVAPPAQPTTSQPAPRPGKTTAAPKPRPAPPGEVRLDPITAYLSQELIDQGELVLWRSKPPWLIAGHDNMGWSWLDDVPTGTIVVVVGGPAAGRYKVVGHERIPTKGDPVFPDWLRAYDLILQTCTGSAGTGFSLAMKA